MSIKALLNIQHKMECQVIEEMNTSEINGIINELYSKVQELQQQNDKLTADKAALVEALEGCACDLMNRDGEMPSTATGWAAEAVEALKQAKGDV